MARGLRPEEGRAVAEPPTVPVSTEAGGSAVEQLPQPAEEVPGREEDLNLQEMALPGGAQAQDKVCPVDAVEPLVELPQADEVLVEGRRSPADQNGPGQAAADRNQVDIAQEQVNLEQEPVDLGQGQVNLEQDPEDVDPGEVGVDHRLLGIEPGLANLGVEQAARVNQPPAFAAEAHREAVQIEQPLIPHLAGQQVPPPLIRQNIENGLRQAVHQMELPVPVNCGAPLHARHLVPGAVRSTLRPSVQDFPRSSRARDDGMQDEIGSSSEAVAATPHRLSRSLLDPREPTSSADVDSTVGEADCRGQPSPDDGGVDSTSAASSSASSSGNVAGAAATSEPLGGAGREVGSGRPQGGNAAALNEAAARVAERLIGQRAMNAPGNNLDLMRDYGLQDEIQEPHSGMQ